MVENKRCILIADDEPKMVRALRDFFRASGFCVLVAKDGAEDLDVFCENSNVIDIILLDVMMPRQDGLTTLKQIRESSSLTPVILLTAKGVIKNMNLDFEAGTLYAIVGESGAGKTTLLSMLSGLTKPTMGEIIYNGKNISKLNPYTYRSKYSM